MDQESEENPEKEGSATDWRPEYIKKKTTNAYGTIEFHGAGKRTRAKVEFMLFLYNIP